MTFLYVLVPPSPAYGWTGLPQAFFFCLRHASFRNDHIVVFLLYFPCFYRFLKTPNRRGTQNHFRNWSIFVLSSHIDPIGEQNDVQYLSIFYNILNIYLVYLVLGTRYIRTYCTVHTVHTVHTVQYIQYILNKLTSAHYHSRPWTLKYKLTNSQS